MAGRKSSEAESGADPDMVSIGVGAGSTGAVVLVGTLQFSALLDSVGLLCMDGELACCKHWVLDHRSLHGMQDWVSRLWVLRRTW